MTQIAYLDCVGGLAGDMLVAALLDAGAPLDVLEQLPRRLGVEQVTVTVERVERQGVGALHVTFEGPPDRARDAPDPGTPEHEHRDWRSIRVLLERAALPDGVRTRSIATFARLADAEAGVHGVPADDVHFHELGSVDTLMDVCGTIALAKALGIEAFACSPLPLARGHVEAAHGTLPLPAPATLALLAGAPIRGTEGGGELVTPTGAALAAELVTTWGEIPPMTLGRVGVGAGTRDVPGRANVVRVLVGTTVDAAGRADVVLLETNLDDFNPELIPDAMDACFAAGALDVWASPVQMKKGRPGIVLSALARPPQEACVARALLEHTSALGVRVARMPRYELDREIREVAVEGGTVRVKVGMLDGKVVNFAPEHDDCAAIATRTGAPVKSIWAAALAAAYDR